MAERYRLNLTEEEQKSLKEIVGKKIALAKRMVRVQVLLAVAENGLDKDDKEVSKLYGYTTVQTSCEDTGHFG